MKLQKEHPMKNRILAGLTTGLAGVLMVVGA
jgi:hypothetical protein